MKKLFLIFCILGMGKMAMAQTLQQVTNNGNTTTHPIGVAWLSTYGNSFLGASLPISISSLSGIRMDGNIGDQSHNGITYQSGGGGGAAIGFFRGGNYNTAIDFYTSAYTSGAGNLSHRMRIDENGNVGIGTTDPQGYKLAVNGSMIAESVKVKLHNTWPDNVFDKSYELRTLPEIEKFINEKKHLPEIPPAEEVAKEGINLGEMNAKLLQKIEELTLHLIEKDKQVMDMQERMKLLERKILEITN